MPNLQPETFSESSVKILKSIDFIQSELARRTSNQFSHEMDAAIRVFQSKLIQLKSVIENASNIPISPSSVVKISSAKKSWLDRVESFIGVIAGLFYGDQDNDIRSSQDYTFGFWASYIDIIFNEYSDITKGRDLNSKFPTNFLKGSEELFNRLTEYEAEYRKNLEEIANVRISLQNQTDSAIGLFDKKAEQTIKMAVVEFNNQISSAVTQSKEILSNIETILDQARELQKELSGRTLSDFFGKRASAEARKATWWTVATWLFAVAALGVLGFILFWQFYTQAQNREIDLQFLGTKVLITATLGFIAKWTSKRANRHLCDESKYHRLAVNILTIESFVSKLDEPSRNDVLKAVAIKTFTETGGNDAATDFETTNNLLDGLKDLIPKGK